MSKKSWQKVCTNSPSVQPIGSMFFIDPLYPLYMLIGVVAALSMKQFAGWRWNASYWRKWANPLCIFSS